MPTYQHTPLYTLKVNPTNSTFHFTVPAISHKLSTALSFSGGLPLTPATNKQYRRSRSCVHSNPEFGDERWCLEFRKSRDLAVFQEFRRCGERFWCSLSRRSALTMVKWFRMLRFTFPTIYKPCYIDRYPMLFLFWKKIIVAAFSKTLSFFFLLRWNIDVNSIREK